jgi:hypothetical protein
MTLCSLLTDETEIEKRIDEFSEALTTACNKSLHIQRASRSAPLHRTVPWWSTDLTMLRKRTNALRRLYQRTRNNEELRGGKHNASNVKQLMQNPLEGKKLDLGKNTAP